jgi:hypothetical protein
VLVVAMVAQTVVSSANMVGQVELHPVEMSIRQGLLVDTIFTG